LFGEKNFKNIRKEIDSQHGRKEGDDPVGLIIEAGADNNNNTQPEYQNPNIYKIKQEPLDKKPQVITPPGDYPWFLFFKIRSEMRLFPAIRRKQALP